MNDKLAVVLAGGVVAIVSWAFWHILGKDAFSTLPTIMLIVVVADNIRLRRQLRSNTIVLGNDT